jgi:hypothetical protein
MTYPLKCNYQNEAQASFFHIHYPRFFDFALTGTIQDDTIAIFSVQELYFREDENT